MDSDDPTVFRTRATEGFSRVTQVECHGAKIYSMLVLPNEGREKALAIFLCGLASCASSRACAPSGLGPGPHGLNRTLCQSIRLRMLPAGMPVVDQRFLQQRVERSLEFGTIIPHHLCA